MLFKGDCFAAAGYISRNIGFVKSGYFKYCILTAKEEYAATGFSFENECVMDFTRSFLLNKPSLVSIIAGSDVEVVEVELRRFRDFILQKHPDFISHTSAIVLEEAYIRYLNHYKKSPSERYLELVERYPDILKRVALRDIASFLQVTPIHLSRIRRKLGK